MVPTTSSPFSARARAAGHRRHARSLLVLLTSPEGVKLARTAEELVARDDEARAATLDALVSGRLVIAAERRDTTVYELAHEVLVRGWPTFARWRHEDDDVRDAQNRLNAGLNYWLAPTIVAKAGLEWRDYTAPGVPDETLIQFQLGYGF